MNSATASEKNSAVKFLNPESIEKSLENHSKFRPLRHGPV